MAHVSECLEVVVPVTLEDGTVRDEGLLPFNRRFAAKASRFRRAQAPLQDLMLERMLVKPDNDALIGNPDRVKVYLLMWTVLQALDQAWTQPAPPTPGETPP